MIYCKQCLLIGALLLSACATTVSEGVTVKNIDAQAAQNTLQDKKVVLLDVRTPEEYSQGHIPGAKLMDFNGDNFTNELQQLDPSSDYIVYCASGGRSQKATELMKEKNFQTVSNLLGGFQAWQSQGLPVE